MGANDAIHDAVAAKIAAHNAAILADLAKPRKRRRPTTTTRRRKEPKRLLGEQPIFGADTPRMESFGQTRRRVSEPVGPPLRPVIAQRLRTMRCMPCDHGLVIRAAKVICPKCGQIFGDEKTLRSIQAQFPGAVFVDDDGEP